VNALVPLPAVLPLLAAGLSLMLTRFPRAQRSISVVVLAGVLATAVALLVAADRDGTIAVQAGGWPVPVGITLVADRLSALLLTVSSAVTLVVLVYAIGQGVADESGGGADDERTPPSVFHPAYLVLTAGVALAFLSGDLFNLFVAFEVLLSASYVLLTLNGTPARIRAGMTYILVSLLSSLLFLAAVALVYAATGTVNFAQLAQRVPALPEGVRTALGLLLLVVFGIKAAVFPLSFWLPDSYPTAPAPVTAVFAGLLTKVGVYAIVRTQTLLFPRGDASVLLLMLALGTMVVGILGAIAQQDIKRMLSFTLVSHIGYMVFGVALFTVAGLAGAILYIVHHITVQTTLFLVSGLVERRAGTTSLRRLGGLAHSAPVVALLFFVPALSLAGIPPLSGFLAKLALLQAGLAAGGFWAHVVVVGAIAVSLLTLYAVAIAWSRAFWGGARAVVPDRDPDDRVDVATVRLPRVMVGATAAIVAFGVGITVVAGPLYALTMRAAADLHERTPYQREVLGDGAP
jgi:multicomponent Na+:H+ antiporter subunit D